MLLRLKVELRDRADNTVFPISGFVFAFRHVFERQVRQRCQQRVKLIGQATLGLFAALNELLQIGDLVDQCLGRSFVAARLCRTDLFGGLVAP